ncbi:Sulfur carrier protein ThiS [Fundidesulfovibrio magnetotacticus]|uniref:Sulfur carrier protein ThiS n=1 Tax=Fundidesulfovibrio magnetotacticus TaxID=2730080 RepID=A0A6V8LST1_9BACT|nr:sulfur carrier protein ThiS [Fundidesulfovibrio magnetotacticus]GFK92677.1 Sulfur carrier protein ThiS [Fundidesulfovibrio magnetotacticus]
MNLRINGQDAAHPEGLTVEALLAAYGADLSAVVVELNERIIPREHWQDMALKEGDRLEIVSFVGGG